ncbi:MAG: hypothetical protein ABH812_01820, partial [bacterium]
AKANNVPYWGNSFGNAYLQAVQWINSNVEENAKLALVQGISTNIPKITLREDINFSNSFWSGIERKGEYLIELTHDDPVNVYPYVWGYVENFLIPVYEVKVDDVAIAKVWKNDKGNSRQEFKGDVVKVQKNEVNIISEENVIEVFLSKREKIIRIDISYRNKTVCSEIKGSVEVFVNDSWIKQGDPIPSLQMNNSYRKDGFSYYFLGDETDTVRFVFDNNNFCVLDYYDIDVFSLK